MARNSLWIYLLLASLGVLISYTEAQQKVYDFRKLCFSRSNDLRLRRGESGILFQAAAYGKTECSITLKPEIGNVIVLSIYRYSLDDKDTLIITDSDYHSIRLIGSGYFPKQKKALTSSGWMRVYFNATSDIHQFTDKFQFTFTSANRQLCLHDEFKCKNELCIRKDLLCDGQNHCGDSSDQKNCGSHESIPTAEGIYERRRSTGSLVLIIVVSLAGVVAIVVIIIVVVVSVKERKKQVQLKNMTRISPFQPPNVHVPVESSSVAVNAPAPAAVPAINSNSTLATSSTMFAPAATDTAVPASSSNSTLATDPTIFAPTATDAAVPATSSNSTPAIDPTISASTATDAVVPSTSSSSSPQSLRSFNTKTQENTSQNRDVPKIYPAIPSAFQRSEGVVNPDFRAEE